MPIKDPPKEKVEEEELSLGEQEYSDDRVAIKMLERRLKAMEMRGTENDKDFGRHGLNKECATLCSKCAATYRNTPFTLGNVCDMSSYTVDEARVLMALIVECGCIDMPIQFDLGRTQYRCSAQTVREANVQQ